jgi:hypothetical protein
MERRFLLSLPFECRSLTLNIFLWSCCNYNN